MLNKPRALHFFSYLCKQKENGRIGSIGILIKLL